MLSRQTVQVKCYLGQKLVGEHVLGESELGKLVLGKMLLRRKDGHISWECRGERRNQGRRGNGGAGGG